MTTTHHKGLAMRITYLVALAASAALFACGNVAGKTQCTKGQSDCVGDHVARTCGDDGQWASQTCDESQVCMAGSCAARTDLSCQPTDSTCTDSTHALVCNANGVGFQSVTCPTGTTCGGPGNCIGLCIVGESLCDGDGVVLTCVDGSHYTQSFCTPGMTTCVDTTVSTRFATAACKPMGCDPNIGTTCGDKATDPTNTDPNFSSECVPSPNGLHWQSTQCAATGSCQEGNGCSPTCTPGVTRCNNNGIQTCGPNGQWSSTIAACIPNANGAAQTCINANGPGAPPVCGDAVCAGNSNGVCEADGYHPCVNGKVAEAAVACATGVCTATGPSIGGFSPGRCLAECQTGDSRCITQEAYQTCGSNGRWAPTATQCTSTGTERCIDYNDPSTDRPRSTCAQCLPGSHRCTDAAGNPGSGAYVETCDSTGHWAATQACTVGQCQGLSSGDVGCVAQCVPGATFCMGGAPASPPNPLHPGTVGWGTCDAMGNLPAPASMTNCGGGTSCRVGPNNQPVGSGAAACVACVGPGITSGNEFGLTDSQCASSSQIEICTNANTWSAPSTCSSTAPLNGQCWTESHQHNQIACGYPYGYGTSYCSDTYLRNWNNGGSPPTYYYPNGCASFWGTGVLQYGNTTDCCNVSFCRGYYGYYDSGTPTPAYCD